MLEKNDWCKSISLYNDNTGGNGYPSWVDGNWQTRPELFFSAVAPDSAGEACLPDPI
jgi:hypothetical protein